MLVKRIVNKIRGIKKNLHFRKLIKVKGGRVGKLVRFEIEGDFIFGERLIFNSEGIDSYLGSHIVIRSGAKLVIGDDTGMTQVSINCRERISIGSNVKLGAGVMIMDSNFHSTNWLDRRDAQLDKVNTKKAPVTIEDDVFIGARSIITKGVNVGARSIIAAGSIVVTDIPSDCIAGGNPCRVLRLL